MIITDDYGNCTTDTIGSGERSCDIKDFGDPTGIGLTTKTFKLNKANDTIDEAKYKELLKSFQIFPFLELYDFTDNTPENDKNTSKTGRKKQIRKGKPDFSFMFDKGSCFHKALYDKDGDNRWNLIIYFEEGWLLCEDINLENIEGFDMGLFSVETFKLVNGGDPQMSTCMLQLLSAAQYNRYHRFMRWDKMGFNANRIGGVVETSVTYLAAPTAAATFSLKVTSGCNSGDVILNLDEPASWSLGGSTAKTISTITFNATNNTYLFTLSAALVAGETIKPKLISAGGFSVAEDDDGNLFKGEAPLATIPA